MRETVRACTKELHTSRAAGNDQGEDASLEGGDGADMGRARGNRRRKQGQRGNGTPSRCATGAVNAALASGGEYESGEQETPVQVVERVQEFLRWLCQVCGEGGIGYDSVGFILGLWGPRSETVVL